MMKMLAQINRLNQSHNTSTEPAVKLGIAATIANSWNLISEEEERIAKELDTKAWLAITEQVVARWIPSKAWVDQVMYPEDTNCHCSICRNRKQKVNCEIISWHNYLLAEAMSKETGSQALTKDEMQNKIMELWDSRGKEAPLTTVPTNDMQEGEGLDQKQQSLNRGTVPGTFPCILSAGSVCSHPSESSGAASSTAAIVNASQRGHTTEERTQFVQPMTVDMDESGRNLARYYEAWEILKQSRPRDFLLKITLAYISHAMKSRVRMLDMIKWARRQDQDVLVKDDFDEFGHLYKTVEEWWRKVEHMPKVERVRHPKPIVNQDEVERARSELRDECLQRASQENTSEVVAVKVYESMSIHQRRELRKRVDACERIVEKQNPFFSDPEEKEKRRKQYIDWHIARNKCEWTRTHTLYYHYQHREQDFNETGEPHPEINWALTYLDQWRPRAQGKPEHGCIGELSLAFGKPHWITCEEATF